MATLNIWDYFQLDSFGSLKTGKQGAIADGPQTPFAMTVDGDVNHFTGSIVTATVGLLWSSDISTPTAWDFFYFWCNEDAVLQVIDADSGSSIIGVTAKVPYKLSSSDFLVSTITPITGGAEPTLGLVTDIYLGNYSGNTAEYLAAFVA